MEPTLVTRMMDAIRAWSGVSVPNAAARHGLADHEALIREMEAVRGTLTFEEEPAGFEAALRDCMEGRPQELAP
jgi:hypothetical protein